VTAHCQYKINSAMEVKDRRKKGRKEQRKKKSKEKRIKERKCSHCWQRRDSM
jgi:hypothetical protein